MTRHALSPLPVWWLPLAAGSLTLFTIHLSYLVAAAHGHVPWCVPYIDSCTSISATGRQWPERGLFKPLMTLSALLVALTFFLAARWLALLADARRTTRGRTPAVLAWSGALMLLCIVAYTAALGEAGNTAKLLRKTGVTLGFGLTYIGEILLFARLAALHRLQAADVPPRVYRALYTVLVLTLAVGVISVLLSAFHPHYHRMDDAFEWVLALLLNSWLIVLSFAWRAQGYSLQPGLSSR